MCMWSLVTVNSKPWVDSVYLYPNLHKIFGWPKFVIERTTNVTFDTKWLSWTHFVHYKRDFPQRQSTTRIESSKIAKASTFVNVLRFPSRPNYLAMSEKL